MKHQDLHKRTADWWAGRKVETQNAIWDKLHFISVKCEAADTCCLIVSTTRICTHSKIISSGTESVIVLNPVFESLC